MTGLQDLQWLQVNSFVTAENRREHLKLSFFWFEVLNPQRDHLSLMIRKMDLMSALHCLAYADRSWLQGLLLISLAQQSIPSESFVNGWICVVKPACVVWIGLLLTLGFLCPQASLRRSEKDSVSLQ